MKDFPVTKKIKYSDIAHVADDIEELCRRHKKLTERGGDFRHIEISPHLSRAVRVVRARRIVEQIADDTN